MDTVFLLLDGQRLTDPMSTASKTMTGQLLNAAAAANEDRLDEVRKEDRAAEGSGAWDAYDVWRRYIKEARERRSTRTDSN
jgi:hypothetical protein